MTAESRKHARIALHWRISVLYDDPRDLELFYATTHTISMTGCSIYLDRHILVEHPVAVQLIIPSHARPLNACEDESDEPKLIKLTALMKYGYLCRARHQFRVGLDFIEFADDGKQMLAEALAMMPQPNTDEA